MKLNKKGFMLAEVVIVASVVSTVLVFLYISLNRMSSAFDKRNRYYDIDAMYITMEVNNILIKNNNLDDYSNDNYKDLLADNINDEVIKFKNFYNNNTSYTINKVYYLKSDAVPLEEINSLTINDDNLKDYIKYLEDKIEFDKYKYLIIVELSKGNDDVYYYTLKVGETNEP